VVRYRQLQVLLRLAGQLIKQNLHQPGRGGGGQRLPAAFRQGEDQPAPAGKSLTYSSGPASARRPAR
jgi:hypothetical protein